MFINFFYLLRARGLKVSMNEWMTLIEALDKGLCRSSLVDFYYLCRSIVVKSESEFDKFDLAFAEFFRGVETADDIPDEVWKWLDEEIRPAMMIDKLKQEFPQYELDELLKMLEERIKEQTEAHQGGNYWVGTGGTSVFGHNGYNPAGIRVGGESRHRSAVKVAGERNFRDFRQDNILDTRQFQMAFRKLRQFSSRVDAERTELDVEGTVQETCDNAGLLSLVYEKPRQNTVKVLLLFDSDGSMTPYAKMCSMLFQAANKSNHFKDIKTFYFHNCIYDHLYETPHCRWGDWIDTEWIFKNLSNDYKVIIVGDASMAPSELMSRGGSSYYSHYNDIPGIEWLERVKRHFSHVVWLNPIKESYWAYDYGCFTIERIGNVFPMFELSLEGLENAIKKLLVAR
ncbi:MAG: VWA domain-containing protein [Clostridiales bacterium]|nr:VWA domain-containing protein [Clostridiales bacterium]MBR6700416.1 VWA domain-containing protein [Bacillota bacterium]